MESLSIAGIAAAFGAGLLSFFSPCTLPVLPVYIGILGSHADQPGAGARVAHALAFVFGLAAVFTAAGIGAGALGSLVSSTSFRLAMGIVVLLLGIWSTGLVRIPALERERRIDASGAGAGGLLASFLMGAAFSLSWTPCAGPVLAAVLALAAKEGGGLAGGVLLFVYALGLGVPFIVAALGSDRLLARMKGLGPYLPKIKVAGGAIIMAVGIWMIISQAAPIARATGQESEQSAQETSARTADDGVDFTLDALDGSSVTLSDYRGTPVLVKFWASWCGPCRYSLPDYQKLFEEYSASGDAVLLSAVTPGLGDIDADGFRALVAEEGYSFPVLLDNGAVFSQFNISVYPTLVFIGADGKVAETVRGDPGAAAIRAKLGALSSIAAASAPDT